MSFLLFLLTFLFTQNIIHYQKIKNNVIIYVDDNNQDIFLDDTKAVLKK